MKVSWPARVGTAMSLALVSSTAAVTNEWIKPSSGAWEEPYWSLGTLPSVAQQTVAIRNPGWKAVAIGANTTANYPGSLRVNDLIIDAPTDSANRLLLNWASHNVPLVIRSNLFIGTNGSLVGHFSALRAARVEIQGFAAFSDSANATFDKTTLSWGGALNLNDATLTCSNLAFFGGSVTQNMGVAVISRLGQESRFFLRPPINVYVLSSGVLYSEYAYIGYYGLGGSEPFRFFQSGGAHSNTTMTLSGGQRRQYLIDHAGYYSLTGGLLVSGETTVSAGVMEQSGGTNLTRELAIEYGGSYTLNGGQLSTSNASVDSVDCLRQGFTQNGGNHTVQNRLTIGNGATYSLSAGTLSAPIIELNTESRGEGGLALLGGEVSNSGKIVLRRSWISVEGPPQQLGKLQVLETTGPRGACGSQWDAPARISIGSISGPIVMRFRDSRDLPWTATLHILNWSTNQAGNGPDRIFVGTSAQALTADQLRRVFFIRHSGLASDYTAALTPSGELVPGAMREYEYVVTNGTVTLTAYTGPGGNVTVPSTIENLPVISIGKAFEEVTRVTSVTLPNTVTNIADWAFAFSYGLTNIVISASVRDIGGSVFAICTNLLAITVHPDNPFYSSIEGVLFSKSQTRLIQFPLGRAGTYAVPQTVRSIENYAFFGCYYVSNVILSASVTNIGDAAFASCIGLPNIVLPEGLRSLGVWAFHDCTGLTSVNLPDSLTSIGEDAFAGCIALIRAEIGRGIATFGGALFSYTRNLAGVYFRGDAPVVTSDFLYSSPIVYYLPGTVGWSPIFAGRPTVPWQPRILDFGPSFGLRTNRFGFVISWAKNATVVVQASSSLRNLSWASISTNTLTSSSSYFSDPRWTNYANRFYRLRSL